MSRANGLRLRQLLEIEMLSHLCFNMLVGRGMEASFKRRSQSAQIKLVITNGNEPVTLSHSRQWMVWELLSSVSQGKVEVKWRKNNSVHQHKEWRSTLAIHSLYVIPNFASRGIHLVHFIILKCPTRVNFFLMNVISARWQRTDYGEHKEVYLERNILQLQKDIYIEQNLVKYFASERNFRASFVAHNEFRVGWEWDIERDVIGLSRTTPGLHHSHTALSGPQTLPY